VAKRKKRLRIGLALGGGSARGLAHIGILKVLHKHKIYPDYIAGTSIGAVIGALYAAGHSPDEIEEIAKTTNWKKIIDFTVPKSGLIEGRMIENKIRKLVSNKEFSELSTPLRVVSYNLDLHEKAIIYEGNVAKAVRASMSIPGIFTPLKIGEHRYIDGAVIDPTPFNVVRHMGADIVIAVDLYSGKKKVLDVPIAKETTFLTELREKFIIEELVNIKNYIIPTRWPKFIKWFIKWFFDKLLYPARVLKIMAGKELPTIAKVMDETMGILFANLARERLKHSKVDIKVTPHFGNLGWADFSKVDEFVQAGKTSMEKKLSLLNKKRGKN
jgi:predicted acylesterase/phospholipase RssA